MTSDALLRASERCSDALAAADMREAAYQIDRLTKRVAELEAERDDVYLAGGHPPEQCRYENLRQFVATRFVPNHEYNRLVEELNDRDAEQEVTK